MTTLTFIGKRTCSPEEVAALELLGRVLHRSDVQLQTTASGDGNKAVARGHTQDGGKPTIRARDIFALPADGFLVYADEELEELLDANQPGWRKRTDAFLVTTPDELTQYIDGMLAWYAREHLLSA